jgi:predicted DNA-binding protein (MmcQ/YjbR family)
MNIEDFRTYCLSKAFTTEGFPFDETTLVFYVAGKMFALTDLEPPFGVNLKCDPERAVSLREHYPNITPGYHMNKKHWNSVLVDESIGWELLKELTDHSYDLVFAGLPKKLQAVLLSSLH